MGKKGLGPGSRPLSPHNNTATHPGKSKSAENKDSFGISDIILILRSRDILCVSGMGVRNGHGQDGDSERWDSGKRGY